MSQNSPKKSQPKLTRPGDAMSKSEIPLAGAAAAKVNLTL